MFLKRSNFGHITAEDLYLGATLNVFSRQVKIAEYRTSSRATSSRATSRAPWLS